MELAVAMARIRDLAAGLPRPVRLMEVCGTHTMAAFRSGLRALLPANVALLSGPGCPVCVTPTGFVDRAIALAALPGVAVATFGDLVRVPGTERSLERARALGAAVHIVYSPLDALEHAAAHPEQTVVFLGVGFETTAPTVAWTLQEARRRGLRNYLLLSAHRTMPPAMAALLAGGTLGVDGFLCPGHVSIVIGSGAYEDLCARYDVPCVVAGFEPPDMAEAVALLLEQCRDRRAAVEIQYRRCVRREGNAAAQALLAEVFEPCDTAWRGLGIIAGSGLRLRGAWREFAAEARFPDLPLPEPREPAGCRCGDVLRGTCTPRECPLFGCACTPATPVGACMVSSEGTCAAYHRYGQTLHRAAPIEDTAP